jgi:hypothetical protein
VKKYVKDRLLIRSIEGHKRIINEGQNVDLESIGFEKGTPLDRVIQYNSFTILTKLNFEQEEAVNPKSASTKYLNELAKEESNVENIIEKLVAYREQIVNT